MLKFKVILVKRETNYLGYLYDSKEKLEINGWSKRKILKMAQEPILREVQRRKDIFNQRWKDEPEVILKERGYIKEPGDIIEIEQVGIEFSYNSYKFAPIEV